MANAVRVLSETVYTDGSGVAGLYECYGVKLSGLHSGERATVTPLNIPRGYRGARAKGIVRTAVAAVERRLVEAFEGAK